MKYLLCAVNSKYIHMGLAVRSLYSFAENKESEFLEFTINEREYDAAAEIFKRNCEVVLFSCYIWNINFIINVCDILKKVSPGIKIVLGGPEVTFDDTYYLEKYPFIDGIIRGEGEETFKEFCEKGFDIWGMTIRKDDKIIRYPDRPLIDISSIPFPYTEEDLEKNKGKLVYYESSRGCPFNCSYCLSSTVHSVRFRDIDMVKEELMFFINHDVKIVKFVDRTFNADRKRVAELIKFLIANAKNTTFHFEIAADLINDELTEILKTSPKGLFQFEIGVQSTNEKTINAVDRKTDFSLISKTVGALKDYVHMHLDLIAGLPYEDINSFRKSFDDVFALKPHVLQLGFLKLLRGTKIRNEEDKFNYQYTASPPYEILRNDFISFGDILRLKGIEDVFEKYYNSGAFSNAMDYLLKDCSSPFDFFDSLRIFYESNGYSKVGQSRNSLYEILCKFNNDGLFLDYLKLDYLSHNNGSPKWSKEPFDKSLQSKRFEILTEEFIEKNLPEYSGLPVKEIIKHVHFELFYYDILLDGQRRNNVILFDNKHNRKIRLAYTSL